MIDLLDTSEKVRLVKVSNVDEVELHLSVFRTISPNGVMAYLVIGDNLPLPVRIATHPARILRRVDTDDKAYRPSGI